MKNNKVNIEDKQIIKYASILALIISIIILVVCFIFNLPKTYVLGFIISFIVNIIGFIKSNYVIDKVLIEPENAKHKMIINNITNNLMYIIVLFINIYFSCFNIVCGVIGLFIIKSIVVFGYGFKK
jgi:hypothetical protein